MRKFYRVVVWLLLLGYLPALAWRLLTRPLYRKNVGQKFGFGLPHMPDGTVWIHAVSVGEAVTAIPLVKAFAEAGRPVVMTLSTPTGRAVAEEKAPAGVAVAYFPLDVTFAVDRAIAAFRPTLFVTIDTELWPNLLWRLDEAGVATAVVNGRISDRSYPRYMRLRPFFKRVLSSVDLCLMQSRMDADRMIKIGADPASVEVAGNLKFETGLTPCDENERATLKRSLGLGDEPVLFLASMHAGEEMALRAALSVAASHKARIVIAPRRIEKIDWIETALAGSGYAAARKSAFGESPPADRNVVPIIDTFGELGRLLGVADVVVVGGSFIPHGGQNPLEAAAHGKPILYGPSMENFRETVAALDRAGAGESVPDEAALTARLTRLLSDADLRRRRGDAARSVIEAHRGITQRVVARLTERIDG